jgi:hypothetical protein
MAAPEIRLAGAALQLESFTAEELSVAARATLNTARSWVQRNRKLLTSAPFDLREEEGGGRIGRPPNVWQLPSEAAGLLRARLEELAEAGAVAAKNAPDKSGKLNPLVEAEARIEARRRAKRLGSLEDATRAGTEARSWIRIAWEDEAAAHTADAITPAKKLNRIAELERELETFTFPDDIDVRSLAGWAVLRMRLMTQKAGTMKFAAKVLRARAEVRSSRVRSRLTSASFGAAVWADEGLAASLKLEVADMMASSYIVEHVRADLITEELGIAIDRRPSVGCVSTSEQAQAVVLGLACQLKLPRPGSEAIRNWLCFLTWSNDWIDALAPPVIFGLLYAGSVEVLHSRRPMGDALQSACKEAASWGFEPGKLRKDSLDLATRWADNGQAMVSVASSAERIAQIGDLFAMRPAFGTPQ